MPTPHRFGKLLFHTSLEICVQEDLILVSYTSPEVQLLIYGGDHHAVPDRRLIV